MSDPSRKPLGIYIGWLGKDNLGDEAMFDVCKAVFPEFRWTPFEDVQQEVHPLAFVKKSGADTSRYLRALQDELNTGRRTRAVVGKLQHALAGKQREAALFGGGTLINDIGMLDEYRVGRERAGRPVPVFGSGVADPEFWTGRKTFVDERRDWAVILSELPVVGVRGPRSKELLEDAGLRNVIISGDSAVWFHQPAVPRPNQKRIGINCGTAGQAWGDFSTYNESAARLAREYAQRGYTVEMFAVWPKDLAACEEVARMAASDRVSVARMCGSAAEFVEWVKRFDAVLAIKLHAGILAAAATVPFV
ncbi:MAG TPA: polysaccharide pyruvyl transferase family protein, partial [Terriglobales bacterium]